MSTNEQKERIELLQGTLDLLILRTLLLGPAHGHAIAKAIDSIALAMAWPCAGPSSSVRRISRSKVPCSNSIRSFCSLVDILGEVRAVQVECQGEPSHDSSRSEVG